MLTIEDVVNDVVASIWATIEMHSRQLRGAEVVLFVEANLDSVQSNGICYAVRDMLQTLHQTSVTIFSDDPRKPPPGMPRRPGYTLTNQRKRACIDKLRQFLALRSVAVSTRFVGREGVDLQALRHQLAHYEYKPLVNKTTGLVTGYEYSGKEHGPDDMATIFFSAMALACIFMGTSARQPYRRVYDGNPLAAIEDAAAIVAASTPRALKRPAEAAPAAAASGAPKRARVQ